MQAFQRNLERNRLQRKLVEKELSAPWSEVLSPAAISVKEKVEKGEGRAGLTRGFARRMRCWFSRQPRIREQAGPPPGRGFSLGNASSILETLRIAMKMLPIVGLLLTFPAAVEVAQAQQLQLEDVPRSGLNPGEVPTGPLDPSKVSALQQAIKSRDYKRAEILLTREIDGHPQNAALLSWLGRIYFLDGAYLKSSAAMRKAEGLSALDNSDRFTLALSYIILKHADQGKDRTRKASWLDSP